MPSDQFLSLTNTILNEIKSGLDPIRRHMADQTQWGVWDEPNEYFLKGTGTGPGYLLLGAYEDMQPPRISLFESSIQKVAGSMGGLAQAIRDTLTHEFWQHRLGLDHTRETLEMGMLPASVVPASMAYGPADMIFQPCGTCGH